MQSHVIPLNPLECPDLNLIWPIMESKYGRRDCKGKSMKAGELAVEHGAGDQRSSIMQGYPKQVALHVGLDEQVG